MLFLIEYDRTRGLLASLTSFDSAERKIAEDARLALEIARNRSQRASEIVLLEAKGGSHGQEICRLQGNAV